MHVTFQIRLHPNLSSSALFSSRGGGGHSDTEGGRTRVTHFAEEGVFFKTSACPRFCKGRALFLPPYEVWWSKSPYNPRNIRGSDAEWLPKWLGLRVCCRHLLTLNTQRIIKCVFPFIQCQYFDKRRGVYLVEKISVLSKKRGAFLTRNQCFRGIFKFW